MSVRAPVTKQSDEWETPDWLFRALNAEFGFTLDAAATKENAKCGMFLTKESSPALDLVPWGDGRAIFGTGYNVFVNPPYSSIERFVKKALRERRDDRVIVMLLPVRTDNNWWPLLRNRAGADVDLRFFRKRIAFVENGVEMKSPPFASMVAVIR